MNALRPDELSANSQIRRNIEQSQMAKKGIKTAIGIGTSIAGAGLASKALPFLNELIPADLALKGINKVAPEIGKFLKKGQSMGLNLKEGLDFLRNNLQPKKEEQQQENPVVKQAKDFETNYPDIIQALMGYINNGRSPQEAATILKQLTPFNQKIKKIEKDNGKNFVDFIVEMMGGNQSSQMQQPRQNSAQGQSQGLDPQLMQIMSGIRSSIQNIKGNGNQQQQAQPQPSQRQNNSDQAIMAALDKILKM